jgi:hypothetical protein
MKGLSSFFARLGVATRAFSSVLKSPSVAQAVGEVVDGAAPGVGADVGRESLRAADPTSALQLLGLLQKDGRLIDFLEQDLTNYSDADIGAAVRVVHEGCRRVLVERFRIEPVLAQAEGSRVTLEVGFDAAAVQPIGELLGEPPFTGTLVHRGWRVAEARLPKVASGHDCRVLTPAEVEL